MQLSEIFLALGEEPTSELVRRVSIGKLRTYQLYERLKVRLRVPKLNSEWLRKAAPRVWARIVERDDEFAADLSQAILVSHLELIVAILDFLGVPHEGGFFAKDIDAGKYLTDGWQERAWEKFRGAWPRPALLFYINHLAFELAKESPLFMPAQ